MRKELIIPQELEFILSITKDKRIRKRLIKVYNALVYKKSNQEGWFYVPSRYLKRVNSRYYEAINVLIEYGIIEYRKSINYEYEDDIFNDLKKEKKKYNADRGICMQYRFLVDIKEGTKIDVEIDRENLYRNKRWYNLTKKSLIELGLEPRIGRDNFSRRLHTNITGNMKQGEFKSESYKDYFNWNEYSIIDCVTSQPRLLWIHLKEVGLSDSNLDYIFENDLDFYEYLVDRMDLLGETPSEKRKSAKNLFASWVNGKGYLEGVQCDIRTIFPIANIYIENFKSVNYKDFCKLLQYKESKIWIDDLLENCPTEFALTVHDSLIVKREDEEKVLNYCENKYPQLKFKKEKRTFYN